jgi:hypothetical protein
MATPGFSISELIIAGKVCKDIVKGLSDKRGGSTSRFRSLVRTIDSLIRRVEAYQVALERTDSTYSEYDSFLAVLEECKDFIADYQALLDEAPRRSWRWWKKVSYVFEKDNVAQLQAQIAMQMHILSLDHMTRFT